MQESDNTQPSPVPAARTADTRALVWRPRAALGAVRRALRRRPWITALVLFALALSIAAASIEAGSTVSDLHSSVQAGQAQLALAEQLGERLSSSPLNRSALGSLRDALAAAERDFLQAQRDVNRLAPGGALPGQGQRISDAQALIGMAVALTGGGRVVLDAAIPVLDGLGSPLGAQISAPTATPTVTPQAGATLTKAQFAALQQGLHECASDLDQAARARGRIHDNGVGLDASAPRLLARYDQVAPALRQFLRDATAVAAAAPALLGVDHSASYLVEVLDQTELRGGGGFTGNYGLLTLSGGRVASATIRDTYLLDDPYLSTHSRRFPPEYSWFPLSQNMGLRDSNLSPDFAYNAQLAEKILAEESGQSVAGVLAITPQFIARLLAVTGPVTVPGYNVTVTSENLVSTIHYFQFQTSDRGVPSSDGISSTRKHFTAVLGEAVFARVRALPQNALPGLLTMARDNLKSKDLQLYLNDSRAEAVLMRANLANTYSSGPDAAGTASTDTLSVVDNNIGGNKAYLYVTESTADEAALQPHGSSRHTLTVRYTYLPTGDIYGPRTFANEVQVLAPRGSTLLSRSGLDEVDAPGTAYGHAVFGGRIYLAPNATRTVTFAWQAPAASSGSHGYKLLVTRQVGSVSSFAFTIQLPSSASNAHASSPLSLAKGSASYATKGPLAGDLELQMTWQ